MPIIDDPDLQNFLKVLEDARISWSIKEGPYLHKFVLNRGIATTLPNRTHGGVVSNAHTDYESDVGICCTTMYNFFKKICCGNDKPASSTTTTTANVSNRQSSLRLNL